MVKNYFFAITARFLSFLTHRKDVKLKDFNIKVILTVWVPGVIWKKNGRKTRNSVIVLVFINCEKDWHKIWRARSLCLGFKRLILVYSKTSNKSTSLKSQSIISHLFRNYAIPVAHAIWALVFGYTGALLSRFWICWRFYCICKFSIGVEIERFFIKFSLSAVYFECFLQVNRFYLLLFT